MAEANTDNPILVALDGPNPNQYWPLKEEAIIIGRDEEGDIMLPDRQVSRQHIRIYRENDQYYITDLESKNGTWVNGQRLEGTRELNDGDEIHVALAIRLQFIGSGATAPLPFEPPAVIGGRLRLESEARRVFIGDMEVDPPLSLPQYRLLELLVENTGGICTRDAVVETVWPDAVSEGVSEQAIDALVRRLRDRLAEVDPEQQYIVTVRGHGFRLDNPTD